MTLNPVGWIDNASATELKILAGRTRSAQEIGEYSQARRLGLLAEMANSVNGKPSQLCFIGRATESRDFGQVE